jgi:hypothetical protein
VICATFDLGGNYNVEKLALPEAHILNDKHFQLTSFEIVVYLTLPKENLELYLLFLDWELGSVRYCESSFRA